jgi:hypothetical protein
LTAAKLALMAPASYTACTNCPCVYLDGNYQTRQAPCSDLRGFVCEFKGDVATHILRINLIVFL